MNQEYINQLKNELKVAKMQYNRVCAHYAQLNSFLYELKEIYLHEESFYQQKAERLLSQNPGNSLEEYKAQVIKEYQDSLNNKGQS
jgi:hypothetical protein